MCTLLFWSTAGTPCGFFNVSSGVLVRVVVPIIKPSPRVMVLKNLLLLVLRYP